MPRIVPLKPVSFRGQLLAMIHSIIYLRLNLQRVVISTGVDFQLNIMKPAVEGKPEVLEAAVKFLQYFSQPDYIGLYAEEWGSSLPATKNSTYSPLLNEWMAQSFPKTPKTSWPQAFVTEQNSRLNRLLPSGLMI